MLLTTMWGAIYLLWSRDVIDYWPASFIGAAALVTLAIATTLFVRQRNFSSDEIPPPLPRYTMTSKTAFILATLVNAPIALGGLFVLSLSPSPFAAILGFLALVLFGVWLGARVEYPWVNSLHQDFDDAPPPPSQPIPV